MGKSTSRNEEVRGRPRRWPHRTPATSPIGGVAVEGLELRVRVMGRGLTVEGKAMIRSPRLGRWPHCTPATAPVGGVAVEGSDLRAEG